MAPADRFQPDRPPAAEPEPAPGTGPESGSCRVYLLRCADGTLYCGWTTDLARRVQEHQRGSASRYTRSRRPVALVWSVAVEDRSAALREEARIKRLSRREKLSLPGLGSGGE